tara:strand:+ start:1400 stop:1738 length:339 start_codon:yes stop_codon:yes gene_type:complete
MQAYLNHATDYESFLSIELINGVDRLSGTSLSCLLESSDGFIGINLCLSLNAQEREGSSVIFFPSSTSIDDIQRIDICLSNREIKMLEKSGSTRFNDGSLLLSIRKRDYSLQ